MGYNWAIVMMKKVLLFMATFTVIALLTSCTKDFLDGYDAGSDGYSYIGKYNSQSACSSACAGYGYSYYRYNYELNNCYCK